MVDLEERLELRRDTLEEAAEYADMPGSIPDRVDELDRVLKVVKETSETDTEKDGDGRSLAEVSDPTEEVFECQYCGRECAAKQGLTVHEKACSENPDNQESGEQSTADRVKEAVGDDAAEEDDSLEEECPYCGDTFDPRGMNKHKGSCPERPEADDVSEEDSAGDVEGGDGDEAGGEVEPEADAAVDKQMKDLDELVEGYSVEDGVVVCAVHGVYFSSKNHAIKHRERKGCKGTYMRRPKPPHDNWEDPVVERHLLEDVKQDGWDGLRKASQQRGIV